MKTERRHQLQTNWLADHLGNLMTRIEPYSKAIAGVAVCALLLVAAYLYLSRQTGAKQAQGWDQYFTALSAVEGNEPGAIETVENVADQFSDSEPGWWARLRLAEIQFMTGVETSFQDRASGNDSLRQSVENFEKVLEVADVDMLQLAAVYGLGRAQESRGALDAAREQYRRLLDTWPESSYASEVKWRLEDLERPETKEFYDWYVSLDPKPSMVPDPSREQSLGLPGDDSSGASFDFTPFEPDTSGSAVESSANDTAETSEPQVGDPADEEPGGDAPADSPAEPTGEADESSTEEPQADTTPSESPESGDESQSP